MRKWLAHHVYRLAMWLAPPTVTVRVNSTVTVNDKRIRDERAVHRSMASTGRSIGSP